MKIDGREIERRVERFKAVAKSAGGKLTHQRVESAHVEVRGICGRCARKSPASQRPDEGKPSRGKHRSRS